ncbi:MAG: succinate dehydrogenase, cytochrome b556 subunit [Gammaproteobacteria bacterium]|nr:succinate dehydrogenase, cytochrome b556 subunit [Gammaproteobacteria bacterium]
MKDNRPRNLDLTAFRWPFPAITSIFHRVSGAFLLLGMALLLYLLETSLGSEAGFNQVATLMGSSMMKFITWVVVSAVLYHLIAGIKHLIMDMGIGETVEGGLRASIAVVVLSAIAIVVAGIWIW